jgi:membrane protein involved in D-alanine export
VIPYSDPGYFLLLLGPLVALVLLGVAGVLRRPVVLTASIVLLLMQYGDPLGDVRTGARSLVWLAAYVGASLALVGIYARRPRPGSAGAFRVAVALALLPLVAAKVSPLVAAVAHPAPAGAPAGSSMALGLFDTIGFLGLSYMTLRVIDLLVVLRDGVVKEPPRAADVASYLLFVPTISAGPIDRFRHFRDALDALPRSRSDYLRDVEAGLHRIAQGLLYKFIVADLLHARALVPLATRSGVLATVGYMYAFSLYLFFDFAGYSAFAIGVGRCFGIVVPENFRAPFLSRNFREMWDRWHITLSWWLRDHVYMRFMLTAARRRWFGGDRVPAHHVALLVTMALMGAWHGLAPQYLVYGLYQGLMLVGYDVVGRWSERRGIVADGPWAHAASVVLTVHLFCFGLLIFSGRLFGTALVAP